MKKLLILLLGSKLLFALTLVPITETLDNQKNKNIIFKVSNPSSEPIAVDFSVLKVLSTKGNQEKREETDSLQAYPTQFILDPKETKSVRVRYMKSNIPDVEEVYRIVAQELDIDVSNEEDSDTGGKVKAKIKMRFSYEGLLFVHKEDAQANLKIENFQKTANGLNFNIKNTGTSSALPNLNSYNYFVTSHNKEYKLTDKDFKSMEFRRVLAGTANHFNLAHIISIPFNQIETIEIKKK